MNAGEIGFVVVVLITLVMFLLSGRIGPRCRCWHHATMHDGPNTECSGSRPGVKNSLGIAQPPTPCECTEFRRTELSWWHRELHGTEEWYQP